MTDFEEAQQIINLARQRVGGKDGYAIINHGEIGELSNGALLLKLAEVLENELGLVPREEEKEEWTLEDDIAHVNNVLGYRSDVPWPSLERIIEAAKSNSVCRNVRNGVCLICGDGVLNSGEHIDPERHEREEKLREYGTAPW